MNGEKMWKNKLYLGFINDKLMHVQVLLRDGSFEELGIDRVC